MNINLYKYYIFKKKNDLLSIHLRKNDSNATSAPLYIYEISILKL